MTTTADGLPTPEAIGAAVLGVEGVAFLRPALTDLLRSAVTGVPLGTGRRPTGAPPPRAAGVRLTRSARTGPAVEIHIVVLRGHRALDVTRAVRSAVRALQPATAQPVPVTVTVTGIV
ncbi:Asp23/Gls24 family envelope stress response protein [Streptomyces sp. NPDC003952]